MLRRILVLLALSPTPAIAQTVIDLAGYYESATPGVVRSGVGGELSYGRSVLQLRFSGRTGMADRWDGPRFWRGDVDLRLAPLNAHRALRALPPFDAEPYLFAGAGLRVDAPTDDAGREYDPNLSWGLGVRVPVIGQALALYGEGRNRGGEWEARGGLSLRFTRGSGRERSAPTRVVGTPPPPPRETPTASRADEALVARNVGRAGATSAPSAMDLAASVLMEAERHLGVKYVWGGSDPKTGFDCSGFVRYVYAQIGISLPRVTRAQARAGSPVPLDRSAFRPGDLLFFASNGKRIDHVAIYVGDGRIIHAPNGSSHVRYDDLSAPEGRWFRERLVRVRRVI